MNKWIIIILLWSCLVPMEKGYGNYVIPYLEESDYKMPRIIIDFLFPSKKQGNTFGSHSHWFFGETSLRFTHTIPFYQGCGLLVSNNFRVINEKWSQQGIFNVNFEGLYFTLQQLQQQQFPENRLENDWNAEILGVKHVKYH